MFEEGRDMWSVCIKKRNGENVQIEEKEEWVLRLMLFGKYKVLKFVSPTWIVWTMASLLARNNEICTLVDEKPKCIIKSWTKRIIG